MFIRSMAYVAVALSFAFAGCAAEHLEARDPGRGPTATRTDTTPVVRPTNLQATEKQITQTADHTPSEAHPASADPSPKTVPDNKPVYVCPMHPEVRADKPGVCPKCSMNLELHEHGH